MAARQYIKKGEISHHRCHWPDQWQYSLYNLVSCNLGSSECLRIMKVDSIKRQTSFEALVMLFRNIGMCLLEL